MGHAGLWVDDAAHLLHLGGRAFPCDREIVASALWKEYALLLSADTDCLSLWDAEGLVRTARVGVYPQDMALHGDAAYICGGADGLLHLLTLPELHTSAKFPLPGMVERVCLSETAAYILTLLTDPRVETALLALDLSTGKHTEVRRFPGLPGCIAADTKGLWVGVSEQVVRLSMHAEEPDVIIDGFGLPRQISIQEDGVLVFDELEGRSFFIRT